MNFLKTVNTLLIILNFLALFSCKNESSTEPVTIPVLTSTAVYGITQTTATSGGNITSDGGAPVTARGICWSINTNPSITDNKTSDGTGIGTYTSNLTGLTPNTTYNVRSYATNSSGTGYGKVLTFITDPVIVLQVPILMTSAIGNVTQTSATSGGVIMSDGGASITARGICWSTNTNPTISDNKTSDGTSTGNFTSNITGLAAYTSYKVRAYATNSVGTGYGETVSFSTLSTSEVTVTDTDGNVYKTIKIGDQVWMAENLRTTKFNDGQPIPNVTANTEWGNLKTPAYSYGNYNPSYRNIYGPWYNWYTVNTGKLAPKGWHIPTVDEWKVLADYLGGKSVAGGKMKVTGTTHWYSPNTGATNESGFSAYPVGYRNYDGVDFNLPGDLISFWTPNEANALQAYGTRLLADSRELFIYDYGTSKNYGYSIRCVKDR